MHAVIATYGSRGDVEPMTALAAELVADHADVTICAPPDEEFTGILSRIDARIVRFKTACREFLTTPSHRTPQGELNRMAPLIRSLYDTLLGAACGCDLLITAGMLHLVAGSVGDKLGIPRRVAVFGTMFLKQYEARDAFIAVAIDAHRRTIGLAPLENAREYLLTREPFLAVDPALDLWTGQEDDVSPIQTGAWLPADQRPLPAGLEAFLHAGDAPVFIGFGSMPMANCPNLPRISINAVREQGRRAVMSRGWAHLVLLDDRDDYFAVEDINHRALFPRVAAVVHHGGAGTTATAAHAAAPQVIVPQVADQPYWSRRTSELGIGAPHPESSPTIASLSAALGESLTPQTRARAQTVASSLRRNGAATAARLLLDM
jgi:vancomycin aglycone glucosyltransferase